MITLNLQVESNLSVPSPVHCGYSLVQDFLHLQFDRMLHYVSKCFEGFINALTQSLLSQKQQTMQRISGKILPQVLRGPIKRIPQTGSLAVGVGNSYRVQFRIDEGYQELQTLHQGGFLSTLKFVPLGLDPKIMAYSP